MHAASGHVTPSQKSTILPFSMHVCFFIRNHSVSNLVLDSLRFNKLLELQGKSQETLDKFNI